MLSRSVINFAQRAIQENLKSWSIPRAPPSLTPRTFAAYPPHHNTNSANFKKKYVQHGAIGEGTCGRVYAGYRRSDNLPVAIKYIRPQLVKNQYVFLNGSKYMIPLEVQIMQTLAGGPELMGKSAAVSLIDWFKLGIDLVLVIERPIPCVDLMTYAEHHLEDHQIKNIMKQLVNAAIKMDSKGVLHHDIKLENILVETGSDVPRVRIIDFGHSSFVGNTPFLGMSDNKPWLTKNAIAITVAQLCYVLRNLMDNEVDYSLPWNILSPSINSSRKVSQDCVDFLNFCVSLPSINRGTLKELQKHPWINQT